MASPHRVAYSPGEFAKLFGKSQTWGYREIYRGNVKAITEHGRILIPAKEVERILESAGIYNGKEKPKSTEAKVKELSPEQKNIWQHFVKMRRESGNGGRAQGAQGFIPRKAAKGDASRSSTMQRLANSWRSGS